MCIFAPAKLEKQEKSIKKFNIKIHLRDEEITDCYVGCYHSVGTDIM